jgi:hypothetical protein
MGARQFRSEWIWLPAIAAGILAIYLPGLGNALVFDDGPLAEDLFNRYRDLSELRVRQLSYGSFPWLAAVFGDGWWKQRLVNLALHAGVVVAVWGLYREILAHIAAPEGESGPRPDYSNSPALGLAVGFFALNPVAAYAVSYLIQRSILMATLFVVSGLWLFMRWLATGKARLLAAAVVAYALAIASKEHAILAPLAALPLFLLARRPTMRQVLPVAAAGVLLAGAAAALLAVKYGEILGRPFDLWSQIYMRQLSEQSPEAGRNAYLLSVMNQSWLFFRYGLTWFLPYEGWMSIDLRTPFPARLATFPQALGPLLYLATIASGFVLLIRYRDWRALVGVSLLLPALLFASEFATVWVQDPFVLYRSYLWGIGVPGLIFFLAHGPSPRVLLFVGLIFGGWMVWQAGDRVLSMANPEKVWSDAIAKLPDDPRAVGRWFPYLNRGNWYLENASPALALKDFESSSRLGDMGMGAFNRGAVLMSGGKGKEALAAFDLAQKQGYAMYNLPCQRGSLHLGLGQPREARPDLEKCLASDPPRPVRVQALVQLGRLDLQAGRRPEAIATLGKLLEIDPAHREGKYLLGMAHVMSGEHEQGKAILDRLIAEDPQPLAYYARAIANHGLKRKAEALSDIDNAARLAPNDPNIREWQARIRSMK